MIEIKSWFTDWHEVNKEQAIKFVKVLLNGMLISRDKKYDYIEKNHLRGISIKELLGENK